MTQTDPLEPWGKLIDGEPGISAPRVGNALGVPASLAKRLATPCGKMKIPYRSEFYVYSPSLIEQLRDHPLIIKARTRRERRANTPAKSTAVSTRRNRIVDILAAQRPDLLDLYTHLVERLWNPATEDDLRGNALYRDLPAQLFDALTPLPGYRAEGVAIVVNIVWAMTKQRTWKVTESREQETPLVWRIWEEDLSVHSHPDVFLNVFAAAIRHTAEGAECEAEGHLSGTKVMRRAFAIGDLHSISARHWPTEEENQKRETLRASRKARRAGSLCDSASYEHAFREQLRAKAWPHFETRVRQRYRAVSRRLDDAGLDACARPIVLQDRVEIILDNQCGDLANAVAWIDRTKRCWKLNEQRITQLAKSLSWLWVQRHDTQVVCRVCMQTFPGAHRYLGPKTAPGLVAHAASAEHLHAVRAAIASALS